VWVWT
ncbi:histidine kinase-, DNA gyrase B-, and HSP90-like ATPase family protein, partial [Vibrio parahaemolyticus SBR10290]